MREMLLSALKSYYVGNINKHIANVEIYLRTSVGIGEHSDIQGSIDKELKEIDKYDARLSMILKYLERPTQQEASNETKEKSSK
tara:strand:+ start:10132 stop:10383 length:252 start_codon:yes stop_codon:yes gene_type:complete